MTHTPTPWEVSRSGNQIFKRGQCPIAKAWMFGNGEGKANAQFIVKAVNSHEKLLEACKAASTYLEGITGDKVDFTQFGNGPVVRKELREALAEAEA